MRAVETLKQWHDFYLLVGTAGATLLALLFVAVSLGAGFLTDERRVATRTFMSPVVIHFTSVFFVSAIALLPWHHGGSLALLLGITAVFGAAVSAFVTIKVVRTDMTNYVEDYLAYGLLPCLGYLALLAAAISIYLEIWPGRAGGRASSARDRQHPQRLGSYARLRALAQPAGVEPGPDWIKSRARNGAGALSAFSFSSRRPPGERRYPRRQRHPQVDRAASRDRRDAPFPSSGPTR